MRIIRYTLVLTFLMSLLLQSCGSGGGKTDTAGSLPITATKTDNTDGTYAVSFTVTYEPTTGKTAQGVYMVYSWYENAILKPLRSGNYTYNSSNAVTIGPYNVTQLAGTSVTVNLTAGIGDMSSSTSVVVPALSAVSGTAVQFTAASVGGDQKTSTVTGGTGGYTITGSSMVTPGDFTATIAGSTVTVTLQVAGTGVRSGTITISDSQAHTGTIAVTY